MSVIRLRKLKKWEILDIHRVNDGGRKEVFVGCIVHGANTEYKDIEQMWIYQMEEEIKRQQIEIEEKKQEFIKYEMKIRRLQGEKVIFDGYQKRNMVCKSIVLIEG